MRPSEPRVRGPLDLDVGNKNEKQPNTPVYHNSITADLFRTNF